MDKSWQNLLIERPHARHKGNTIRSKAHRAEIKNQQTVDELRDRRDYEMGHAFCERYGFKGW